MGWERRRALDMRSSASVEVEAIRERWAEQVNDALELAQVAERVDHRNYARQRVEMEPAVKMGHASAAIERRAYAEQIAAGEEPHAVTPRGQMNEAIEEKRGLETYLVRGREWLQEMGQRLREQGRAGSAWHGEPDDAGGVVDQCRRRVCPAGTRPVTPASADASRRSWPGRARSAAATPARA